MNSVDKLRTAARNMAKGSNLENHEECNLLLIIANEIEAEIERDYMRLPVDKDGVPIHPGDNMTDGSMRADNLGVARWDVVSVNECAFFDMSGGMHIASQYAHYHSLTVEDVMHEFWCACQSLPVNLEWKDTLEQTRMLEAEYADKLREVIANG